MKTNKSLAKRVKITGNKKLLKRSPHQNHFNAKESGNATRGKHGLVHTPKSLRNPAKHLLYNF